MFDCNKAFEAYCDVTAAMWKTCALQNHLSVEEAWRLLRMPFVLPVSAKGFHVCVWELLDLDCAGCLICGSIHRCGPEVCLNVEQTDDSIVCLVTGICVRSKKYAEHEFSNNVIVFSSATEKMESVESRMRLVKTYVHEFLTSKDAERLALFEHQRKVQKYHAFVTQSLRGYCGANLVHIIQQGVHLYGQSKFDMATRECLASKCAAAIQRIICVSQDSLGLVIKESELRNFVFGMIFLMRSGVTMQNVPLLPQIEHLNDVLPSENNVGRFLKFRSKCITDTENRFKFLFRQVTPTQLDGMHLTDHRSASHKHHQP